MANSRQSQPSTGVGILWTSWFISTLISLCFAVLGAVTFNSLNKVYQKFPAGQDRRVLHGAMAAALAAPVLVVLLDIVSLFILFFKTWKRRGTGFSYGFLDASFLHQGLFAMLASFILLSDRDLLQDFKGTPLWTSVDSTVYTLAYVMGFIVAGTFIFLFLLLIACQGAVRDHNRRLRAARFPNEHIDPLLSSEPSTPRPVAATPDAPSAPV